MFSKIAKVFLVATAFAPVLLTLAFLEYIQGPHWWSVFLYGVVAVLLGLICKLLLVAAKKQLEILPFRVHSIKTADNEILAFVIAYLLPFAGVSGVVQTNILTFILVIIFAVIWTTHAYHCNPILGLFGYHFYEIVTDGNITFILITHRTLRQCKEIRNVVQLTDYIVLDSKDG
jgi:hypothetical protein